MDDKVYLLIGAVLIAGVTATQIPALQARQDQSREAGRSARLAMAQTARINANDAALKQQSATAIARYNGHCEAIITLKPVTKNSKDAAPIQEGRGVVVGAYAKTYDPARPDPSKFLGPGINVCDLFGKTATIALDENGIPVASDIAVTNDEATIERFRAKNRQVTIHDFRLAK